MLRPVPLQHPPSPSALPSPPQILIRALLQQTPSRVAPRGLSQSQRPAGGLQAMDHTQAIPRSEGLRQVRPPLRRLRRRRHSHRASSATRRFRSSRRRSHSPAPPFFSAAPHQQHRMHRHLLPARLRHHTHQPLALTHRQLVPRLPSASPPRPRLRGPLTPSQLGQLIPAPESSPSGAHQKCRNRGRLVRRPSPPSPLGPRELVRRPHSATRLLQPPALGPVSSTSGRLGRHRLRSRPRRIRRRLPPPCPSPSGTPAAALRPYYRSDPPPPRLQRSPLLRSVRRHPLPSSAVNLLTDPRLAYLSGQKVLAQPHPPSCFAPMAPPRHRRLAPQQLHRGHSSEAQARRCSAPPRRR
mmetsp:Transcript_27397/g.88467  ORF Transcript_27397/g.88467 Transcript_27397/m.88467 type:complete len:354 (+) Transcript_27397:2235-3296(+)